MASDRPIRKDVLGSILDVPVDEAPGLAGLARLTHRDPTTLVRENEPEDGPAQADATSVAATSAKTLPGRASGAGVAELDGLSRLIRRDPGARPPDDAPEDASDGASGDEKSDMIPTEPIMKAQPEAIPAPKPPSAAKSKTMEKPMNLSEATTLKLEQAKEELARHLPPEAAKRLSMSLVCEVALRIVLGDLAKKGEGSLLVKVLRKLLAKS